MNAASTYIIFELNRASYGVRSQDVLHIDMLEHITSVPNTVPAVEGVVFSRGRVVPAMNLRVRFGFPAAAPTPRTRLIFIQAGTRVVALIVDSASEFRVVPPASIQSADPTLVGIDGNYVRGAATIAGRLVLLLDVAAVLNVDDHAALAAAESAALQPLA